MDPVPPDAGPIRAIGDDPSSIMALMPVDEVDQSIFEDPVELVALGPDDEWPPHFGAARLGIP